MYSTIQIMVGSDPPKEIELYQPLLEVIKQIIFLEENSHTILLKILGKFLCDREHFWRIGPSVAGK